ncbi:GTPase family protein [Baaleninema simplex]|uniref:GTPase family protein n=1 Tax=Baaleninema simplex TaxID=2862350 RepID=UPI00034652DB|nr:GTPase family protein [Baaleninema simplex]
MVRLKPWQWAILSTPIASIAVFLLVSAGIQIHNWGINWIWGIVVLAFAGWRWLLVKWTQPAIAEVEAVVAEVNAKLESVADTEATGGDDAAAKVEPALQRILEDCRDDAPIWEDWPQFWQRCQDVVVAVANAYHPEVKYPLLSIYVPQAYGLIRGTVDDLDRWMQQLSPVLGQVTVGQAYQGYEMYQKLEPSARKLWKIWNVAQWVLNPAAAIARQTTQKSSDRATQQLLGNLSQMLREAALRNLAQQAVLLYGGTSLPALEAQKPQQMEAKTQTLREILDRSEPTERVEKKPVNLLLVGRTGAGKSSLINTLFQSERAEVDVLPSTDAVKQYVWESEEGETLTLWDTPGYEQANRNEFRELVLDYARTADAVLLVTPALDPALQMDADFLQDLAKEIEDLPTIAIVTQIDRLRPIREWNPPYNWEGGDRPKEKSIREATHYRREQLGSLCKQVLPLVTRDETTGRTPWNAEQLSVTVMEAIEPAKQLRLARFLRDREAKVRAAAKIIDRYTFQMATTQGVTTFLKSPVLQFISTLTTGQPTLAYLLAEQIPVEQLPIVIGKLQMAYDLFSLLSSGDSHIRNFDLLSLWPVLLDNPEPPDRNAWSFGHALVEYWTRDLSIEQFRERFEFYEKGQG